MSDRITVGRVGKPHGLDGAFFVDDASDDQERFVVGADLLVDGEPATVVESKRARDRTVIRLDRSVARGVALEVPRESLAALGDDEYYVFQLIGLEVVEEGGTALGCVVDVEPGIANDVLALDSSLRLPMVEDCVRSVVLDTRRIVVAPGFADPG